MKKVKKVYVYLMVLVLTLNLFTGCESGNGDDKGDVNEASNTIDASSGAKSTNNTEEREPIKMAVVLRDAEVSPSEILIYKEIEEKTGVKIDWQTSPDSAWQEKKSLLFASDDLPDAFYGGAILSDADILKYGTQGMIVPLEDYITPEIMPNLSKVLADYPEFMKAITAPDGHIYGLPAYDMGITPTTRFATYINKDWLENIGMEVPTTTEEFYQVLKAFKENDCNNNGDPDDEIPMTFSENTQYASYFLGAFGIIDEHFISSLSKHIDLIDGVPVHSLTTENYKEAVQYFNKLFKEGLVDQEAFTQDNKAFRAKLKAENRTVGVFNAWRSNAWANTAEDDDYIPMPPLVGPNGDQLYPEKINGLKNKGAFAISHKAEDPAYIMAWVDNVYEPFIGMQMSYALKAGVHIDDIDGDGKYESILEATRENRTGVITQGKERIDNVTPEGAAMLKEIPSSLKEKHMLDEYYNQYYRGEHYPKVFFTLDEVERISILTTDINGYADEMYAKWMQVGGVEEEWDGYLNRLNEMGLDELMEIYQTAYDRFNQ